MPSSRATFEFCWTMCSSSNVDVRPSETIESISWPLPSRYPKRAFFRRYGAFVIDSMPPVTMHSCSPARIIASAISIARIDDAHTLLIVSAGVSIGRPAPTAACRARARRSGGAGAAARLPRGRLPGARLQHLPHDDVLGLVRLEADPLEGRLD